MSRYHLTRWQFRCDHCGLTVTEDRPGPNFDTGSNQLVYVHEEWYPDDWTIMSMKAACPACSATRKP